MKTLELTGPALDWAVAKCAGVEIIEDYSLKSYPLLIVPGEEHLVDDGYAGYSPSTDWAQGGPIIEREGISIAWNGTGRWQAANASHHVLPDYVTAFGPTPLIAAMRCYVASKLGDEVTVPEELT